MDSTFASKVRGLALPFFIILQIGGVGLLAVGIYVAVDTHQFRAIVQEDSLIYNAAYLNIILGGLVIAVTFLGYYGTSKEKKIHLYMITGFLCVIFVLELLFGVSVIFFYNSFREVAFGSMTLYGIRTDSGNSAVSAWDAFQGKFECCGIEGASDWIRLGHSTPPCSASSWTTGCEVYLRRYVGLLGGTAVGFLFVEMFAIMISIARFLTLESSDIMVYKTDELEEVIKI